MKIFVLNLILISFFLYSEENDYTKKGTPLYVMTESSSLNLRDSPNKGKVIAKLIKGEKITLLKSSYTEPITSGWTFIKTSKGNEGYVSDEFISRFPIDEVEKMEMISSLQVSVMKNHVGMRPIIYKIGNKWIGNGNDDKEPAYFLNKLALSKSPIEIFDSNGSFINKLKISSTSVAGCQNYIIANIPQTEVIKSMIETESLFVLNGLKVTKQILKENSLTKEQISIVQKESESILKKNKIKDSEIQKFKLSESSFINEGNRELISARFHLEDENKLETKYLYLLFESKSKKIILQEFKELSKDLIGYGGENHLIGVLNLDGLGTILIYKDFGFDASIKRIMKLEKDKLILVANGGGDAC